MVEQKVAQGSSHAVMLHTQSDPCVHHTTSERLTSRCLVPCSSGHFMLLAALHCRRQLEATMPQWLALTALLHFNHLCIQAYCMCRGACGLCHAHRALLCLVLRSSFSCATSEHSVVWPNEHLHHGMLAVRCQCRLACSYAPAAKMQPCSASCGLSSFPSALQPACKE